MINYSIKKYEYQDTGKVINVFDIEEPHRALIIICSVYDKIPDLDFFIQGIEELLISNIPDYSEEGNIKFQPILFDSKKSKIAGIRDGKFIGGQEFDTKEFLEVCYAWREFLKTHSKD